MNLKTQHSIVSGSPCSYQNNAMPCSAEKSCFLGDHQNISGEFLLEKDKWLKARDCFLSNPVKKRKGKKKSSNCSPLNIPENFTGLIIDRKGKKPYKNFLPLTAI